MKIKTKEELALDSNEQDASKEKHVCCICGKQFIGYGNNPSPYKERGECCNECDKDYVLPLRFCLMHKKKNGASEKELEKTVRQFRRCYVPIKPNVLGL